MVREDLHFWAEVRLPSGDWLVIEPTPGYEVLGPSLPWSARVLAGLLAAGRWLWEHVVGVSVSLAVLAVVWWQRLRLSDACAAALVRLFPGRSWQRRVRRVLWLLECRGRWVGRPRPSSQTPSTWLRRLACAGARQSEVDLLTMMADWNAYAPELVPPWPVPQVRDVCRRVLAEWTLQRWRIAVATTVVGGICK